VPNRCHQIGAKARLGTDLQLRARALSCSKSTATSALSQRLRAFPITTAFRIFAFLVSPSRRAHWELISSSTPRQSTHIIASLRGATPNSSGLLPRPSSPTQNSAIPHPLSARVDYLAPVALSPLWSASRQLPASSASSLNPIPLCSPLPCSG
jgi:hypothetical protein